MALPIANDAHHGDASAAYGAAVRSGRGPTAPHPAAMEAVGAVRKKITTSQRPRSGSRDERAGVEARAETAVAHTPRITRSMAKRDFPRAVEPRGRSPDLPLPCGRMPVHRGFAVHSAKSRTYRHRGIGPCDLMHHAFARDAGASMIAASDAAFADMEGGDDMFGSISVQMTGSPLIDLLRG